MKLIDIHTHGIGGYDTRTSDVAHILRIAELHGSYGVSEIVLTIYPATIKVMRENIETVRHAVERQKGLLNQDGKSPTGDMNGPASAAKIVGVHLEGPFLNPAECGALNAITFIEPAKYAFEELIEGYESIVKMITIAPEMSGAPGVIKEIADRGIIVSMGHSQATYAEAEEGFHAGARGITHIFNAMRGIHHREPGIAGFGLLNKEIYVEVIADGFHLHPKTVELIFRTKPRNRIIIVSDAVKETKTLSGENRDISDSYGKLLGGSLMISESSDRLIQMGFDEEVVEGCITANPAAYLPAG